MPDPKLNAALEEIKAVVHKHDIAAVVFVQSPGFTHFFYEFSPSWSCAKLRQVEDGGVEIRVRCKREDYPSKEAQKKDLENTIGMLMGFMHVCEETSGKLTVLVREVGKRVHIEHMDKDEGQGLV